MRDTLSSLCILYICIYVSVYRYICMHALRDETKTSLRPGGRRATLNYVYLALAGRELFHYPRNIWKENQRVLALLLSFGKTASSTDIRSQCCGLAFLYRPTTLAIGAFFHSFFLYNAFPLSVIYAIDETNFVMDRFPSLFSVYYLVKRDTLQVDQIYTPRLANRTQIADRT